MEKYKIEIFKNELCEEFPKYKSLNSIETINLLQDIDVIFNLELSKGNLYELIMEKFQSRSFNLNSGENLKSLLKILSIEEKSEVFIIWNHIDIDLLSTEKLLKYWDFIWYKDSDEVLILYFKNIQRILLITEFGLVYYN